VLVNAALICERILHELDGTLTAVRIVDQVTYWRPVGGPKEGEPVTVPMQLALLIVLKDPTGPGDYTLRIVARTPMGAASDIGAQSVNLSPGQGEVPGLSVGINLVLSLRDPGLHWFDIYLNEALISSVPLHVRFDSAE
jgi:hypothetical protein